MALHGRMRSKRQSIFDRFSTIDRCVCSAFVASTVVHYLPVCVSAVAF